MEGKKKKPKCTHTYTRSQSASAGSKACNHLANLEGEFFRVRHDRYLPICLPASTSNKSGEQETRQRGQVAGRSEAFPFDVCESAHQCGEPASSRHGGSPRLTLSGARLIVSPSERAGLLFSEVRGRISSSKLGSCFLIGLHLSTAQAAAQANTLMIRGEACLNSPLFLLPVRSSRRCCIFISSMCYPASSVAW